MPEYRPMFTARTLALPAIALAVIVALAQAHGGSNTVQTEGRTVYRAVTCSAPAASADAACTLAGNAPASMIH
jgi:hypothetical protein